MEFDSHIADVVQKQAKTNDETGELSPEVLDYIYKHRLFKLFLPPELGGTMTPLPEALRIFAESAYIDGDFGWLITIGSGGGYFAANLSRETSAAIFSADNAVIAGSGQPTGKAVKTDGGYYVTGNWRYCSGSLHATTFTANCVIEDKTGKDDGKIRAVAMTPDQVTIIKDWNAFGLKGTASHTIAVENVFVPEERTFDIDEKISFEDEPIYRFPFLPFAQASFAAVLVGLARRFLEEAKKLVEKRAAGWDVIEGRSDFVRRRIAAAEKAFEAKAGEFAEVMAEKWKKHIEEGLQQEDEKEISAVCIETAAAARGAANDVFPCLGMEVIKEGNLLLSIWKDIQTAAQHLLLAPLFK